MMILGFIVTAIVGTGLISFAALANTTTWPDPTPWLMGVCGVVVLISGLGGTIWSMAKKDWMG